MMKLSCQMSGYCYAGYQLAGSPGGGEFDIDYAARWRRARVGNWEGKGLVHRAKLGRPRSRHPPDHTTVHADQLICPNCLSDPIVIVPRCPLEPHRIHPSHSHRIIISIPSPLLMSLQCIGCSLLACFPRAVSDGWLVGWLLLPLYKSSEGCSTTCCIAARGGLTRGASH